MKHPGLGGTGRLQQEQGLTTPRPRVSGTGGCEAERQLSGVIEPRSSRRLLLRGFSGPTEQVSGQRGLRRRTGVFTIRVEGHGGGTRKPIGTVVITVTSETSPHICAGALSSQTCAGRGQHGVQHVRGIKERAGTLVPFISCFPPSFSSVYSQASMFSLKKPSCSNSTHPEPAHCVRISPEIPSCESLRPNRRLCIHRRAHISVHASRR